MTRRRALVVAAALLLVLAGGLAALLLRPPTPFVFRWPAGNVYTYRLALEAQGSVAAADTGQPGSLAVALAVDGELELRSYGRLEGEENYLLGARLRRSTRVSWTLGGQPLLPEGEQTLVGPELALVVAPDGTFRSINAAADTAPALLNLFRQLLGALEIVVAPGERSWTREQTNQLGDVRVAYEVRAGRPGVLALARRPLQYTRLAASAAAGGVSAAPTGRFEIALDRAGHLERIEGAEQVAASSEGGEQGFRQDTRIEARLLSVSRDEQLLSAARASPGRAGSRLAGLVSSSLGDVSLSPDAARQAAEQRIAGLTMKQLVQDLQRHGSAAEFPDAGRWMWRSTGLLRLHPELCRELVAVFKSSTMTDRSRGRVLDLLAGTGSPEAQAVLRQLLETPEAKDSAQYALFLQRLSLVQSPVSETVDYLRAKVGQGGDSALAAAHALGAAVRSRSRTAGGEVDERAAALLRQGLSAARSEREKADWLGALGNAGLAAETPLIERYAADSAPAVRAAAAGALRDVQTPASEKILFELAADSEASVQDRALHTLKGFKLDPDHFDRLRDQVAAGRLAPRSQASLMTLLERNRAQPGAVLPVVQALLARGEADQRTLLRLRALQASLSSTR